MMIQPDKTVSRSRDLVFSVVDEDWMAIDPKAGYGYSLNKMGHQIWEMIEKPTTINDICCRLRQDFDVEESVCHRQVMSLIRQLDKAGLIRCDS